VLTVIHMTIMQLRP